MKYSWLSYALIISVFPIVGAPAQRGEKTDSADSSVEGAEYSVTERAAHHRVMLSVTTRTNKAGVVFARTNSYTELATGMHYITDDGQWAESREEIEILPKGAGAVARHGQHKVIFPSDIYEGAIQMYLPDGQPLRSRVLGLSYYDTATGKSVLIAETTNSVGELHGSNVVIYPEAFTDFRASVRLTYTRAGFEQDIILFERPPSPKEWDMNPETTRLQVLTEFFDPPQPSKRLEVSTDDRGVSKTDEILDFPGNMQMGIGRAFSLDGSSDDVSVSKQWLKMEGRDFLVEEVEIGAVEKHLETLPRGAGLPAGTNVMRQARLGKPSLPTRRQVQTTSKPMRMAKSSPPDKGFVLDYVTLNTSQTNYVFQSGGTYYFSGNVSLHGTNTTFEGGAVLKYTNGVTLTVNTPVKWQAESYRPVAMLARDDNSVGTTISGSSGNPGASFYAANALLFNAITANTNLILRNVRVANATRAIVINAKSGHVLSHAQIVNCAYGLTLTNAEASLRNALMYLVRTNFAGTSSTGRVEHLTSHQTTRVNANIGSLFVTNSLFVLITNATSFTSANNRTNTGASGIFTNVGGGFHYLVSGSTNRNVGTTNVSTALLTDLKKLTTFPPLVYTNLIISTNTTWNTNAPRDFDQPDIGYHYDPLDYAVSRVTVTNATLTVTNGASITAYGSANGLTIEASAALVVRGSAESMSWIASYDTVQERNNSTWATYSGWPAIFVQNYYGPGTSDCFFRYVGWSTFGTAAHFEGWVGAAATSSGFVFDNCQIYRGSLYFGNFTLGIWNSLIDGACIELYEDQAGASASLRNNLIRRCSIQLVLGDNPVVAWDNLFDSTYYDQNTEYGFSAHGFNAYFDSIRLIPEQTSDVTLTNRPDYVSGPLGHYYYPTTGSSLSLLQNAGSRNADAAGLYHYTVTTNLYWGRQIKETNSVVDIGFHYVASSITGQPSDFDGDGIADYREDANGDGVVGGGETEWRVVITNQPQSHTVTYGNSVTFSVGASGQPLYYQWLFNNTNALAGATSSSYTLNSAFPTNAGLYSVIVSNAFGEVFSSNATLTVTCLSLSGLMANWQAEGSPLDSASNYHGVLVNGSYTNGNQNSAFQFDGTNTYVVVRDQNAFALTNFTVETWVRFDALKSSNSGGAPAGLQYIAFKQNTRTEKHEGFALAKWSDDTLFFGMADAAGNYNEAMYSTPVTANVWYHVAGVRGSNYVQLYVNGVLRQHTTFANAQDYGIYPLYFGTSGRSYDGKLKGKLDEVSIYNRALSSNEVASIYKAGSYGKCPPTTRIIPPHLNALTTNSTTFASIGSGASPVSYQWSFNGTNIANATNAILQFTNLQVSNSGNYSVTLSNSLGVTTSSEALLVSACFPMLDIMLVIDRSGSMTSSLETNITRFQGAQIAASNFVANLNTNFDQCGLVHFADYPATNSLGLTNDLSRWNQAINNIPNPAGNTFMSDALLAAHAELNSSKRNTNALPVIVFLSDGQPTDFNGSSTAAASNLVVNVANELKARGSILFTVALSSQADTNFMRLIASSSKTYYVATNFTQLTNVYYQINTNICRGPDPTNQSPVISWVTPANNQLFVTSPTNILLEAAHTGGDSINGIVYYQDNTPLGAATSAPYQFLWQNVTNGTYNLKAIGTNSQGASAPVLVTNIVVNAMPVVNITFPTQLQPGLREATNVTLWAGAFDPAGAIQEVRFYTNSLSTNYLTGIRDGMTTNYSALWSGLLADYYSITAVAIDTNNASSLSSIRVFQVTPTNLPPTVWISYPTNNETFRAGADITITADVSAGAGVVTNVEFFSNGQSLGTDPDSPYSVTVCCWEPGTYTNVAKATDSYGATAISSNVVIVVDPKVPASGEGFWDYSFILPTDPWLEDDCGLLYKGTAYSCATFASNIFFTAQIRPSFPANDSLLNYEGTNWTHWRAGCQGLPQTVCSVAVNESGLYVLGGGSGGGRVVARWNGSNWIQLGEEFSSPLYYPSAPWFLFGRPMFLKLIGPDLFVGGNFSAYNGTTNIQFLARWNTNALEWEAVGNGLDAPPTALESFQGKIVVGGIFTNAGGDLNANKIAELVGDNWKRLGSSESRTNLFNANTGSGVYALAACGNNLYVGGDFHTAGGKTNANGIVVWNGSEWTSVANGLGSNGTTRAVYTLSARGDTVYAGGDFGVAFNEGTTNVPVSAIARATWHENLQKWIWTDLDYGLAWGSSQGTVWATTIMEGPSAHTYDVLVGGDFYVLGKTHTTATDGFKHAFMARWRVGYPAPPGAPSVAITNPVSMSIFTNDPAVPFLVPVVATASSPHTNIARVAFYVDDRYVNDFSLDDDIYTNEWPGFSWSESTNGVHILKAVAIDEDGAQSVSEPVLINVKGTNNTFAVDDAFVALESSPTLVLPVTTNDAAGVRISRVDQVRQNLGRPTIGHDGTYISYTPLPKTFGTERLIYTVTNNLGLTDTAWVTVKILAKPFLNVTSPSSSDKFGLSNPPVIITIAGDAHDFDGSVTNISILLDESPWNEVNTNSFSFNWTNSTPGFFTFEMMALDNDGLSNKVWLLVNVYEINPTNVVTASIDNLAGTPNDLVGMIPPVVSEGFFDLEGKARDSNANNPVSYHLQLLRPEDNTDPDAEPIVFANVTPWTLDAAGFHHGRDTNGVLGRLDFSGIPNGTYDLKLIVHGGGTEATTTVRFRLETQLKIGQFGFSEQDLVLPVNGIPITVTRTYNSLNQRSADFGYSWTYALNSMDVQLDEWRETVTVGTAAAPEADVEEAESGLPLKVSLRTGGSRDVTLTLPDGRRTTFVFNPDVGSYRSIAKWEAAPGVTATLKPLSSDQIISLPCLVPEECVPPYWSDGEGYGNSDYENDDVKGWVLENQDGTKFYITRGNGNKVLWDSSGDGSGQFIRVKAYDPQPKLTKIEQRSGDYITLTDTNVSHFDKNHNRTRSVFMQRDAAGRVIAIFDPNSGVTNDVSAANGEALVKYVYNRDTGNLIQVHRLQDRTAGNYLVTKYHYDHPDPKFAHYITSIEDPRGIPLARNEYDDDGRLTAVVDADGKRTEFGHDTNGRFERVIDRGGSTNTFVYDAKGNVIFTTNAIGVVTATTNANPDFPSLETAVTNALGTAQQTWTLYAYNEKGHQTNVVTSPDHTNSFRYDDYGNLLWQRDPVGNITTNGYDSFGNLTNTVQLDANGNPIAGSTSVYANGHLTETRNASNQVTASFTYDPSGNLTDSTDANGVTRHFGYDANGNQTNSWYVWTNGVSTIYVTNRTEYDAQGRAVRTIDPFGNTNSTFYNALGKVDYTVDKFGNTNSFLYDTRGNLIRTTDAQGLKNYTVYDDAGRAFFTTDRNGITATHTYFDAAGRATNVVRVTNAVVTIDAGPQSVLTFGGYPISTNSTEYFDRGWVKSRTGPDGAKTTYGYWPDGQTMYVTNVFSTNVTFFKYDIAGRQEYVVDALNRTNRFEYDAAGRVFKTVFHNGTYTSNYFNSLGQRTVVRDQAGLLTKFGYDVSGQLTNVIKPGVIDPLDSYHTNSPSWAYSYDAYGRLHRTIDPLNHSTTNTYDEFGREVTRWLTLGETNWTKYNLLGQVSEIWDFKKQKKMFVYDRYGRVATNYFFDTGATYPSNTVIYVYNQLGQLTNITERWGTDASIGYVAAIGNPGKRGRFAAMLAQVEQLPPGPTGGALGLVLSGVAAMIWLTVEARRRRVPKREFIQTVATTLRVQLSLSTRGLVASDACHERTQIPQWLLRVCPSSIFHIPSSFIALCSFAIYVLRCGGTPDGTPKRLRLPSYGCRFATVVTLIALIGCDPAFDGFWTARAACDTPTNPSVPDNERITIFTYDLEGRVAQVNTPEGVINYEYELATGRHIGTCTGKSKLSYQYDDLGRLWKVNVLERDGAPVTGESATYEYTEVGSRKSILLANGVKTSYAYDELNRLTGLTNRANDNSILSQFNYQVDATGRRTNAVEIIKQEDVTVTYQTNTLSWAYDGLYRLTNEVCVSTVAGASYTNAYQYDLNGNRWQKTRKVGAQTETIKSYYNANDQLSREEITELGGTLRTNYYVYDANGSVVAKTNATASTSQATLYGYDLKNKLSSAVTLVGSPYVTNYYRYNESGIRVRTSSSSGGDPTLYLVDGNNRTGYAQVLEELKTRGSTPDRSYVLGDDVLAQGVSGAVRYLLYDGHGSTRQLSPNAANANTVVSRYNYDAYGATLTASSSSGTPATRLLYCGEQYDSTLNMYNLRARFYDASNGRFNAMDSFLGNNDDPQSLHKYLYAHGDPVNGSDPSGNMTLPDLGIAMLIGAGLGALLGAIYGGIKAGVKGAVTYGALGLVTGALGAAAIIGAGMGIAAVAGVSEGLGIFYAGSLAGAYGIGSSGAELILAETPRERYAALFALSASILLQGAATKWYVNAKAGRGTYTDMSKGQASELEIEMGRLAADHFKADLVSLPRVENAGVVNPDFTIALQGKKLEFKDARETGKLQRVMETISHAQADNVMILVKEGQLPQADISRIPGRLFSPKSGTSKNSVTIVEQLDSGYGNIQHFNRNGTTLIE